MQATAHSIHLARKAILGSNVLVLNRNFTAVTVTSVKRAFCMLFSGHVEVVQEENGNFSNYGFDSWREISELKLALSRDEHEFISTVSFDLIVPRVVRLLNYSKLPKSDVKLNRRNIFARDQSRCQYCGKHFPLQELSIDHVVPRTQGGGTSWHNLVCACLDCNTRKGGRRPDQAGMKLINEPVKPKGSPIIRQKLKDERYKSWKAFLDDVYWSVELEP